MENSENNIFDLVHEIKNIKEEYNIENLDISFPNLGTYKISYQDDNNIKIVYVTSYSVHKIIPNYFSDVTMMKNRECHGSHIDCHSSFDKRYVEKTFSVEYSLFDINMDTKIKETKDFKEVKNEIECILNDIKIKNNLKRKI